MRTCLKQAGAASVAERRAPLRAGEVVGIPTETVRPTPFRMRRCRKYSRPKAVHRITPHFPYRISGHAAYGGARSAGRRLPAGGGVWPGPLTLILPRSKTVADSVCAGLDTASVRMPSHPVALAVIRAAGVPLAAPSANLSGSPSPTTAADVLADMEGQDSFDLDGGACSVGWSLR